jgi:hypothetical protein
MSANTMTAAFWVLLGLSFLGIFAVLKDGITSGPSGGAVGAWLVVFPMLFLVGLGVVFALAKSEGVRMVCVALVALPLLAMGSSMMTEGGRSRGRRRGMSGRRAGRTASGSRRSCGWRRRCGRGIWSR